MNDNISLEINITKTKASVREIELLRLEFVEELKGNLRSDQVEIYAEKSRAIDPVLLGTIGLALLPSAIDKIGDFIIKWADHHNDCSITLSVPVSGKSPISITYNPRETSSEELRKWIDIASKSGRSAKFK